MKTWDEIYKKEIKKAGGTHKYLHSKITEKEPLLRRIISYAGHNGRILEAGCGTGVLSTHLSNCGFKVVAVDIDEDMLKVARKISKNYSRRPKFKKHNLFLLDYPADYFDVVFSHGVLEHFLDRDIVTILKNELRISKTVIVSIPSNYFREKDKMFGDERFLSLDKWKSLISKTPGLIIEIFGFHYLKGWQAFWDSLMHMKLFGSPPYVTFILRKKP